VRLSVVIGLLASALSVGAGPARAGVPSPPDVCRVVKVFDGDTIAVACGGREDLVRYIGINAPETHHPDRGEEPGGREATTVNEKLVAGRRVRLELDVERRDVHQRLLAYVWVLQADGTEVMANAHMLAEGYARLMTIPPNVKHTTRFVKLQRQARRAGRGLWAADHQRGTPVDRRRGLATPSPASP
jgi:micrococcal nuclease